MTKTIAHSDIKKLAWVEKFLPVSLRPYAYLMRIDRPVGIWLLLLPGLWSIALASPDITNELKIIALFIIGAIIMRGAGCVINDLWDHDLDKMVERTRNRPIASGVISTKKAIVFLATLLLAGLTILLQFNIITIILGFLTIPLIFSYPLMKRITWWPQAFLGLTFNFGALMGWSAITGGVSTSAILLYIGGIFWTLGYDTIYAHQDKEDDILAGIKSTALKLGSKSKLWVCIFYATSITLILSANITANGLSLNSGFMALPALHFIWQIKTWAPNDQASSLRIFKSNKVLGVLILLSCLA